MIGLGILEFGLLVAGGAYIYALLSRKNNIQFIELDQNQFQRLQTTLVANNILPTYMVVNTDPNSTIIPPTYDESNLNHTLALSRENNNNSNPAMLEVTTESQSIMDAPAYCPSNQSNTLPDNQSNTINTTNISNTSNLTNTTNTANPSDTDESQILLPSSNLYPSITN